MPFPSLHSYPNTNDLNIIGSVADSTALPDTGQVLATALVTEDNGHAWMYTGSVSEDAVDGWIDLGPAAVAVLPLPLYAITGYTAAIPAGETILNTYASMTALLAAVPPTAQGERIQVAGAPYAFMLSKYEGHYIAGSWAWLEV